jgi:hypothetical protein
MTSWLHLTDLGDWKSIQEKWVPKALKIAEAFNDLLFFNLLTSTVFPHRNNPGAWVL